LIFKSLFKRTSIKHHIYSIVKMLLESLFKVWQFFKCASAKDYVSAFAFHFNLHSVTKSVSTNKTQIRRVHAYIKWRIWLYYEQFRPFKVLKLFHPLGEIKKTA